MLHRVCWSAWAAGTALILLSWVNIVSPTVGWVGFAIACSAALLSYLPQRAAQGTGHDWAVLTQAMLEAKDHGYDVAMEHFRRGGTIFYDGMAFTVYPNSRFSLVGVASVPLAELDEIRAQREAERLQARFEALTRLSPEVAGAAQDKALRVSLISEYGARGFEICQVAEGRVEWKIKGKGRGASSNER